MLKTHRSKMRRARALWRVAKPTPQEVIATGALAAMFLFLVIVL